MVRLHGMALHGTYASVDAGCRNRSPLRDKNFYFTLPNLYKLHRTIIYSRLSQKLYSPCRAAALYVKVIIVALVVLLPYVSFPLYSLHGLLQQLVPVCSLATSRVPLRAILFICLEHKVVVQLLV